ERAVAEAEGRSREDVVDETLRVARSRPVVRLGDLAENKRCSRGGWVASPVSGSSVRGVRGRGWLRAVAPSREREGEAGGGGRLLLAPLLRGSEGAPESGELRLE